MATTSRKPRAASARSHARKPKVAPGVNLVDTAEEIIKDDEQRVSPPREKKPGPKKVLDETGKAIADAGAIGLVEVTKGTDGKGLLFAEAQSLTAPLTRILGRRIPDWLKKFVPSVKINPDDAADIEEIAVTLGKYALRILMLTIQEYTLNKEKSVAERQQRQATGTTQPANVIRMTTPRQDTTPQEPEHIDAGMTGVVSTQGHNPAFNDLGVDIGMEA